MEGSFERSKVSYKSKIPDIEQTLELIKIMKKKAENAEEMFTNYSLCDTIYAKAKVLGLRYFQPSPVHFAIFRGLNLMLLFPNSRLILRLKRCIYGLVRTPW